MDRASLEQLGLEVTEEDGLVEAVLQLVSSSAINPLTRKVIDRVTFSVMGNRLLYVAPREFVGGHSIDLASIPQGVRLEDFVSQALNDYLYQLQRGSRALGALGLQPKVDPTSLELTSSVERGPFQFSIAMSRVGKFRVTRATHEGIEISGEGLDQEVFELSAFADRQAIEAHLVARCADLVPQPAPASAAMPLPLPLPLEPAPEPVAAPVEPAPVPASPDAPVPFRALAAAFAEAMVAVDAPLEIIADLRVGPDTLRFAASHVHGVEFRALLAGPGGKIWSGRFELPLFPGVRAFVAGLLQLPLEQVEVAGA